jgi:hypothetical protein
MFMEDLITKLAAVEYVFEGQNRKFIRSVGKRVEYGNALTTRQAWAFAAIARKTEHYREIGMKRDQFFEMLAKPMWRKPLIPSVELRSEVRHLGDNMLGFRTSNGRTEIEFATIRAQYSKGMKIVAIENKAQMNAVIEFIGKWGFEMDRATEEFLAHTMEHEATPTRVIVEGKVVFIDVPNQHVFSQFAKHVLGADPL